MNERYIDGFSKLTKAEKINWLATHYLQDDEDVRLLKKYWLADDQLQSLHDGFTENPVSNYILPYAVAPNFLVNGKTYAVPMVTEESSVVAAAAKAAKFWYPFGGFHAKVTGKVKTGHIHLIFKGEKEKLASFLERRKADFLQRLKPITENMEKRGGGILSVALEDLTDKIPGYYTVTFKFDTVDSMGANFINTVLEEFAMYMEEEWRKEGNEEDLDILMRILSNYNPECKVHVKVEAPVKDLPVDNPEKYVDRFITAVKMAEKNIYRAVTHNKGIMNGIDAVVLATGNDFRAVEAGAHAYASRHGEYTSLSKAYRSGNKLIFEMSLPLALGTVGGVTVLHPLAKTSMKMLGNPPAEKLMEIVASVGLAQNFSAVHSLITEGIQKGHMKMHLNNILMQLGSTPEEMERVKQLLGDEKVHVKRVKDLLEQIRKK